MVWSLALLPLAAGAVTWLRQPVRAGLGRPTATTPDTHDRAVLGLSAVGVLVATLALGIWAAVTAPAGRYQWGVGLTMHARVVDEAAVMAVLVPAIAIPIVAYAALHEDEGLTRLVALLLGFVGSMLLLVIADDLLTLLVGWELVGVSSWALISHQWWEDGKPTAAAHAFNATRFGDLGLFLAAGGAYALTGSLRYSDLVQIDGAWQQAIAAGIVLAAASKSAQLPFSPWLYSAMGGPTPVSALLHAATMVAAGAYLLARLSPSLDQVAWFAPAVIGVGLATAIAGGIAASVQHHVKKLLAASTSAHYGLMFIAIGAGSHAVAMTHLVTHAAFKALLFLTAGIAISAVGSEQLARMRLGSTLRATAAVTLVGTLALAGVPPLGAAWSKEKVVAAVGEHWPLLAVAVMIAGALSAFYAARFQILAFGRISGEQVRQPRRPHRLTIATAALLAGYSALLGVLWIPAVEHAAEAWVGTIPPSKVWETATSLALAAAGIYGAWALAADGRLATLGAGTGRSRAVADWLDLPRLIRSAIVDPSLALCRALASFDEAVVDAGVRATAGFARMLAGALARFDEAVVDGGVRGTAGFARMLARGLSTAGEQGIDGIVAVVAGGLARTARDVRRVQTGMAHHYYVVMVIGLIVVLAAAGLGR